MHMTVTRIELPCAVALTLVTAAMEYASRNGLEICASVCDSRGVQLAFLRSDGVIDPAVGFAIDKAYTAALLRRPTAEFAERAIARPPLQLGLANRERLLVFPGGLPVVHEGKCIGGIGISGATDEDDVKCARAALEACGFR